LLLLVVLLHDEPEIKLTDGKVKKFSVSPLFVALIDPTFGFFSISIRTSTHTKLLWVKLSLILPLPEW